MALVSVGTTATRLDSTETDRTAGQSVSIHVPTGGSTVYVDVFATAAAAAALTVNNGTPIAAGEHYAVDLRREDEGLYGIIAGPGSQPVRRLETGL